MITLNDIQEARGRFEGHVTETPLVWSQSFSRLTGRDVQDYAAGWCRESERVVVTFVPRGEA